MTLLDNPKPIVAIIGVGAVGGFYGARLIRSGSADVHLLLRSDFDAIQAGGLKIRSYEGDFELPASQLKIYRDARDMPKPDLVLITLKATGNDAYSPLISPLLGDETVLLTIQNGLGNEDRLAELFGAERVVGGMAFVCINRLSPGVIHHIDHGFLKIGEFARPGEPTRGVTPRTERIAAMFQQAGVRCDVLPDLRRGRWEKLVWNIPFNGLGASLELTTDRLIGTEAGLRLVCNLMREVIAIANAEGVELPADLLDLQIRHTQSMGPYQTSMQVDRRAGRRLEVEAIVGEALSRARKIGIETPYLAGLYDILQAVDQASSINNLGSAR